MFWIFKKEKKEKEPSQSPIIPEVVQDIQRLTNERELMISWINYLKNKDLQKDSEIVDLGLKIERQEAQFESIKTQISETKDILEKTDKEMAKMSEKISSFPDLIRTKSGLKSEPTLQTMEKNIIVQTRSRKKEYVFSIILNLIENRELTTKQLEILIVNEKGLCGRTAFYDYIKELKNTEKIRIIYKGSRKILGLQNGKNRFVSEPNSY